MKSNDPSETCYLQRHSKGYQLLVCTSKKDASHFYVINDKKYFLIGYQESGVDQYVQVRFHDSESFTPRACGIENATRFALRYPEKDSGDSLTIEDWKKEYYSVKIGGMKSSGTSCFLGLNVIANCISVMQKRISDSFKLEEVEGMYPIMGASHQLNPRLLHYIFLAVSFSYIFLVKLVHLDNN